MTRIAFARLPTTDSYSTAVPPTGIFNGTYTTVFGGGHGTGDPYGRFTTATAAPYACYITLNGFGVFGGDVVTAALWVNGTPSSMWEMSVVWSDGTTSLAVAFPLTSSSVWTQVSGTVQAPPGVTSGRVRLTKTSADNAQGIDYDDLDITVTPAALNINDYTIQEDGGNLDPSKLSGGFPTIDVSIGDFATSSRLMDDKISIDDDLRGNIQGTVRNLSGSNGTLSVNADGLASLLNTYRSVPPMNSTNFGTYIPALLSYLGIPITASFQASVAAEVFPFVGFTGNVLDQLKALCAARNYEMNSYGGQLRFRASRVNTLAEKSLNDSNYTLNTQQSAQQVVVNYQNYSTWGDFPAYPPIGSLPADLSPITVNANETVVQTYSIGGTAASVSQPVAVDSITLGATNQYAVIGNDGLPVTAAQWVAGGGSVSVRVLPDDPSQIEVTVRGASNKALAPYRLAESSGNNYSALYIQAQGYSKNPKSITLQTGASPNVTSEKIGVTVDNPYISTLDQAYTNGLIVSANYAGPQHQITATAANLISPANSNQIIGFGVGNRIVRKDAAYITTSVTTRAGDVGYTATLDTLFDDFNTVWSGQTFNNYNNQWMGYTFTENTPIPLRRN